MAKIPFSKLQTTVNNSVAILSFPNKTGEEICFEVKKYLPYRDKIELVSSVINQSIDDNGYYTIPLYVQSSEIVRKNEIEVLDQSKEFYNVSQFINSNPYFFKNTSKFAHPVLINII